METIISLSTRQIYEIEANKNGSSKLIVENLRKQTFGLKKFLYICDVII